MPISKAQISNTSVAWNSVNITRVTSLGFRQGGQLIRFKGDTDIFSTIIANTNNEPSASVTSADIATLHGFVPGTSSTFTASMPDARSVSAGGIAWTMINAVFENADSTAPHAQFGTVTGTWQAYSSDGTTPPLSFTRY